jgi:transposase-like protein
MNIKHWISLAGLMIALVIGGIFVSSTSAQSTEPTPVPPQCGERGPGRGPERGLLGVAAEMLDMTIDELVAQLDDDTSIADVAAAQGVAADTIVDAVVAQAEERMQQAVENGRLTEAEAAERLAQMRERVSEHINEPGMPQRPQRPDERQRGPRDGGGRNEGGRNNT